MQKSEFQQIFTENMKFQGKLFRQTFHLEPENDSILHCVLPDANLLCTLHTKSIHQH